MAIDLTATRFQAMTAAGPEVGAQVFTYAAGTLTPLATFTNAGGGSANANPVICDANGQADIWLTASTAYRIIVKRSVANGGATISDTDNYTAPLTAGGNGSFVNLAVAGNLTVAGTLAIGTTLFTVDGSGHVKVGGATAPSDKFTIEETTDGGFMQFLRTAIGFWRVGGPRAASGNDFQIEWNGTSAIPAFGISTVGDVKALGISVVRAKSATTARPSTTTLADDPHLIAPLTAGASTQTYGVTILVPVWATTGGAGGFKWALAFSGTLSSAFLTVSGVLNGAAIAAALSGVVTTPQTAAAITTGTGVTAADWLLISGSVTVSVDGNLSFQWAQNALNVNAANVGQGGYMSCERTL